MSYTIVDLLDKFILIEQKGYEMFMEMAMDHGIEENIKILLRVFANEEKRHAEMYRSLKEHITEDIIKEIDFSLYDKVLKLIYEFSNRNRFADLYNKRELLNFCLDFEKENLALALSIQGILVTSYSDIETSNYQVLEKIISEERKHIENIEAFLK